MKSKWKQQKIIHDYKLMYLTIYLKKKEKQTPKIYINWIYLAKKVKMKYKLTNNKKKN